MPQAENILVHEGRMDQEEIREELSRLSCDLVLDATHPFARIVSENIKDACAACRIPCFRPCVTIQSPGGPEVPERDPALFSWILWRRPWSF